MGQNKGLIEALDEWAIEAPLKGLCIDLFSLMEWPGKGVPTQEHFVGVAKALIEAPSFAHLELLRPVLKKRFKFEGPMLERTMVKLDYGAKYYATSCILPLVYEGLNNEIDQIEKMARAAKRLKGLLPAKDSPLMNILEFTELTESGYKSSDHVVDYFKRLNIMLDEMIQAKQELSQTHIGRLLKVGQRTPKGNTALKIWMHTLRECWLEDLNRTFQSKGQDDVNGRARFIDLCYTCIVHIDPRVKHSAVENLYRSDPTCKFDL